MNRLQIVISNLIGPEQNYAVKGKSIQDNLQTVREVLEGLEDDTVGLGMRKQIWLRVEFSLLAVLGRRFLLTWMSLSLCPVVLRKSQSLGTKMYQEP